MADIYNRFSKGQFWTKVSSTVNPTDLSSQAGDANNLSPPPYTVQDSIWDAAKGSLPSTLPEPPTVIAVMGPTGTGKSTFISKLAGREMNIGHNLSSCTQGVEEVPCKVGDRYVVLVDTPGFNDTERSDTDILTLLADWMKGSYNENILLSGIIYLHSISEPRMTNSILTNLRMFRRLCGDENLKNVMLATTKWGITPPEDAERRDDELHSKTGFWAPMIAAGSLIRRFENSTASAQALIERLLQDGRKFVPVIQREMAQGKKLSDTGAGAYLDQALNRLKEQHRKEKDALREEMKRAEENRDKKMQEVLEIERHNIDKKIAEKEEEQRELHISTVSALQTRLQTLEQESRSRGIPRVKQGFWHLSWKCLACKTKTDNAGKWACPDCKFVQFNER